MTRVSYTETAAEARPGNGGALSVRRDIRDNRFARVVFPASGGADGGPRGAGARTLCLPSGFLVILGTRRFPRLC